MTYVVSGSFTVLAILTAVLFIARHQRDYSQFETQSDKSCCELIGLLSIESFITREL